MPRIKQDQLVPVATMAALSKRRKSLGLSGRDVARHARLSSQHVSNLETGVKRCSRRMLCRLVGAMVAARREQAEYRVRQLVESVGEDWE